MGCFVSVCLASILILVATELVRRFRWKRPTTSSRLKGPSFVEIVQGFISQKNELHLLFTRWSQVYGKFYAITIGPVRMIILNDHKTIREGFSNPHLLGRPEIAPLNPLRLQKSGIIRNEGKSWALQRKITVTHFRRFGFGSGGLMENLIVEEIIDLIQDFKQNQNQSIHMNRYFFCSIMNIIWSVVGGIRLTKSQKDQEIKNMFLNCMRCGEKACENPLILMVPYFVDYWPWLPSWKRVTQCIKSINKFLKDLIEEHKRQLFINGIDAEPTDFIYAYLKENCLEDFESRRFNLEAEKELEALLVDFVIAGFDTISSQLDWVFYYLVTMEDIQEKLRQELDRVVGRDRLPNIADRPRLPYIEACILESMRRTPAIPIGAMHQATADTTLFGYPIKKYSMIISNIYGAQHDSDILEEPDSFRPERHLQIDSETGLTSIINQPYLLPFGSGGRMCVGDHVAKDTIFLLVATIFSKFLLKPAKTPEGLVAESHNMVLVPPEFFVTFEERI